MWVSSAGDLLMVVLKNSKRGVTREGGIDGVPAAAAAAAARGILRAVVHIARTALPAPPATAPQLSNPPVRPFIHFISKQNIISPQTYI